MDKGGAPAATPATTELLAEATQLLKSLRMPNLKVMRLSNLQPHAQMVLLDSGATHGLRPAVSEEEWQSGTRTQVMLADGVTESLRLKPGTKVLLSDPLLRPENASWIVPMGCLNELNYKLVWKDHMCHLYTKAGEKIDVELHNGCPYFAHEFGAKLLTVLEQHQIQQELKKMTLKSILTRGAAGLGNNMSIEMAMLVKLKEVMPTLPEDLALKLVPDLSVLTDPNIGLNLPWNRRKRKRLMMAKNVIIHMYSGPDASYWERRLSNEHTEVLCVDLEASTPSNALDETTFAFLLSLCASKRVKALLGGPPCRTTSALRFQKDDGPPILRTEDHPYGLPSLTPQQAELVTNDSILWLRLMLMYILCEEVRPKEQAQTAFLCEQPQDPAEYRKKEDVDEHQYFSMWRTQEWKSFQEAYNAKLISFDQGPFGHPKRKPTTLALINMNEMMQLQDVRGRGAEPEVAPLPELSVKERCALSKTWAAWAPGMKAAVAEAISRWIRREAPPREGPEDPTGVVYAEDDVRPVGVAAIGNVALQQWKQHYLQDHMPARRDCSHCVRSQGRSRAHRRVVHPEAFTLSLDMSGRMTGGKDQTPGTCKYFLVGCYTYPVNKKGKPLLLRPDQDEEEDHPLPGLDQKEEESDVEEDLGEAPNSRDGGSSSAASNVSRNVLVRMSNIQALQTIHDNVSDYIAEEICKLDGTFPEQMWCLPELNKALVKKVEVEEQIQLLADEDRAEEQQQLTHEFLVTKTVSNKEVRENLADWTESIKAEYEQLVVNKKAVKPMSRAELQKMAEKQNKTLEILPAKMVHTRKAGSGAYRSRAVVCGNYQTPNDDNTYAGGADATQIRTMLRISAQYKWKAASTDIRTAFRNAPRRDSRLIAMEVPHVYKMLGLAGPDEVWLINNVGHVRTPGFTKGLVSTP